MSGFNWVVGSVAVPLAGGDCEGRATCYSIEVAGYRVVVTAGHWDEDQAVGGWDAYKAGVRVDGGYGSADGFPAGVGQAEAQVTYDALEAAGDFLLREVGEETLVEAGVYEVPEPFDLRKSLEEEARMEAMNPLRDEWDY